MNYNNLTYILYSSVAYSNPKYNSLVSIAVLFPTFNFSSIISIEVWTLQWNCNADDSSAHLIYFGEFWNKFSNVVNTLS